MLLFCLKVGLKSEFEEEIKCTAVTARTLGMGGGPTHILKC